MRTAVYLALVGAAAATDAADCKDAKSKTCTVAMCYKDAVAIKDTTAWKGCA